MPQLIQWNSTFSVGNPTLDEQHKRLLGACNALAECSEMQGSVKISRFHELLNELAMYVREHFATEESILQRCGYANLAEQKAEHFEFEEHLVSIISDATFGIHDIPQISRFMSEWWTRHILQSDMKYKGLISGFSAR